MDLMIVAILIIICSLFGLPWFVAATVLSINHVRSLTRESETSAPGEKPQFLGKYENMFKKGPFTVIPPNSRFLGLRKNRNREFGC